MNLSKNGIAINKKNLMICTVATTFLTGQLVSQDRLPEIDVTPLSASLYKFSCGVNNWLASVGPDGVLLSDTGPELYAEALESELKKLESDDVTFIINTHWHHDHTSGNLLLGKEATIIAHNSVREDLAIRKEIALFGESFNAYPEYAWPNLTFDTGLKIYFNGEEITIRHLPRGHTGGDAVVYFKNAGVIHVGDMITMGHFPAIECENGGDVDHLVENLEIIISEMSPDTKIITGHLRDANQQDMIEYCNMIRSTIEVVKNEMKTGASLKDMQEKEILRDWSGWGEHITCDMWIATIYECLK
jgi:glyoxylase-like metal-dependent hydrolase (beta-lactamase superfamily II)